MLCLKRARGEAVQLFLDGKLIATVGVQSCSASGVRLSIKALPEYVILRAEIPLTRKKRTQACGQPSESPSSAGSAADCS